MVLFYINLYIISFFLFLKIQTNEEITLKLNIENGKYGTFLKLYNTNPSDHKEHYAQINLRDELTFLFIQPISYLHHYAKAATDMNEDFYEGYLVSYSINAGILLDNNISSRIDIFGTDFRSGKDYIRGLCFGYHYYQLNQSLTHQLYKENQIHKLSFTFHPGEGFTTMNKLYKPNGKIYFGDIPYHLIRNKLSSSCKVQSTKVWDCFMSKMYIRHNNNKIVVNFNLNTQIGFNSYYGWTFATKDFMEYLEDNIFKDLMINKFCWKEQKDKIKGIMCGYMIDINMFNEMEIVFVIDNYEYKQKISEMFVPYDNGLMFEIVYPENMLSKGEWILGGYFLQRYITTFDYENKMITFYNLEEEHNSKYNSNSGLIFKCMYVNMILLGCSVLLLNFFSKANVVNDVVIS